jgi:aminomethyltransferase
VLADDVGIVDDVIVYGLGADRYLVIANAGNRDAVAAAFAERAQRAPVAAAFEAGGFHGDLAAVTGGDVARIEDVSDAFALLAVQGPHARAVLEDLPAIAEYDRPLAEVPYYAWAQASFASTPLFIARTGYTGEDGFELLVPTTRAEALWDALLAAGAPHDLVPAGLASRDTLRLEAGMPLYGHELSRDIRPAQAGLGRVVVTAKDDFVGKGRVDPAPGAPVLVGLVTEGKRAGRAGYAVTDADGTPVGEITSGALSPTLGHPIAMAFVAPDAVDGPLFIDVRGTRIPATVTALPFYRRNK